MSHAEKCPVCHGKGYQSNVTYGYPQTTGGQPIQGQNTCIGCGGKGWVTVEDSLNYIQE